MKVTVTRKRFAATAAAFASIAVIKGKAGAAEFTFKFGNTEPIETPLNIRGRQAFDRIRKESNGRVDIQMFPNNILGGLSAMVTQMRSGALTFLPVDGITLSSVVDVAGVQGVGFAFKDIWQGFTAFDGDLGALVKKEIRAKGLFVHDHMLDIGMRQITSFPRAIRVPDDLTNFKIRTPPGRLSLDLFRSFGASPVPLNFSEVYTSLQTHIIDGQENPPFLIELGHLFEVQKYLSLTSHQWSGYWLCGNLDTWNSIPRDLQAIISKNFAILVKEQRRDTELLNATLVDKLSRRGMSVNRPDQSPFRARLGPFYQKWKGEFGDTVWSTLEKYAGRLG